jgi:plasmid stabilization system protein ParE
MSPYALHPDASTDLAEIRNYIAAESPDAADGVIDDLCACIRTLAASPQQGRVRPELASGPIRFIPVRDYLIAYAPEKRPLLVIAVIHGYGNPRLLRILLRDRA